MNDLSDLPSQFAAARAPRVSIVLPVRDAVDELADFIAEVAVEAEYAHLNLCEIIMVDDGSRDLTWAVLQSLVRHESRLRPIRLRSRFGVEAARETGVLAASGDIIISLEPGAPVAELGQLAGLIEADHDVVTARHGRSRLAGGTASYRRETLFTLMEEGLPLAALPATARRRGYRVAEVPAGRAPRRRLGEMLSLLGSAIPARVDERVAGLGMLAGVAAMLLALPMSLVPGAGLVALAVLLGGLQIAGVSLIAGLLLLRSGRRAQAQARIAETLLGHGARD